MAKKPVRKSRPFRFEALNGAQKMARAAYDQNEILFLSGPAGVGKTFLAVAFAINDVLSGEKSRIILTRPAVDAGEKLGFLPGSSEMKMNPYIMPIFDCISALVGYDGPEREKINKMIEIAPLAFLRGRTFVDAVCIFDEAQNATLAQLKLYLTRIGKNSKMIITGDPTQSDLPGKVALGEVMSKLQSVPKIGLVEFKGDSIVRHPLISAILEKI